MQVHGIVVEINVQRHTAFYLVSMVVPIMVCYALIRFGEEYTANISVISIPPFQHVIRLLTGHNLSAVLTLTCVLMQLTVYLANLVFFLSPTALDARLGDSSNPINDHYTPHVMSLPNLSDLIDLIVGNSVLNMYCLHAGSVVALFLALAAIQFVVSQNMPASSYITGRFDSKSFSIPLEWDCSHVIIHIYYFVCWLILPCKSFPF